jgi:hypothetical protein
MEKSHILDEIKRTGVIRSARDAYHRGVTMKLNLANVLELVVAAAAGMALARFMQDLKGTTQYTAFTYLELAAAFLAGISLLMGLRLWVEASRPREHRLWGIGRWAWSLSAASIVLHVAWMAVAAPSTIYRREHRIITHDELGSSLLTSAVWAMDVFPGLLIAFLITALVARWPRDPHLDYREWTGRAFAGLLIIRYAALQLAVILQ